MKINNMVIANFLVFVGAAITTPGYAADDLVNCIYKSTGIAMDPKICEGMRRYEAQKIADAERYKKIAEEDRARAAQAQAEYDAAKAVEQQKREVTHQEWVKKNEAQKAELQREQDASDREYAAEEKAVALAEAKRKTTCGDDYKNLQIGMAISRAQQCVSAFKLVGQLNRADGVVSTYRSGYVYAHVMNGRIVSWSK
jgi:hypothetical protein